MKGDLANAYAHGRRKTVRLSNTGAGFVIEGPPNGKRWMVLDGMYMHVTGTNTFVFLALQKVTDLATLGPHYIYEEFVASADATQVFPFGMNPINGAATSAKPFGWQPHILTDADSICYASGAAGDAIINVLEWDDQ